MNIIHNGREIEIETSGYGDELEITAAYYLDGAEEDVDDKTVDMLWDKYAADLDFAAYEQMVGAAEAHFEGDR